MADRRYTETEVAEIFQRATEAQHTGGALAPLASSAGMTLGQLQEIGREVGLAPELVAHAARSLDRTGAPMTRRFLGLPIGVGHTVELERTISEQEWERLVVDLRETFDARGSLRHEGSFRSWNNGNLQALLEPTPSGQRLRLRTMKGDARAFIAGGLAMMGFGAVSLVAAMLREVSFDMGMLSSLSTFFFMGLGMFGFGALRLPSWSRERRRQFAEIAARLAAAAPPPNEPSR